MAINLTSCRNLEVHVLSVAACKLPLVRRQRASKECVALCQTYQSERLRLQGFPDEAAYKYLNSDPIAFWLLFTDYSFASKTSLGLVQCGNFSSCTPQMWTFEKREISQPYCMCIGHSSTPSYILPRFPKPASGGSTTVQMSRASRVLIRGHRDHLFFN
jgi:hypothetical protein